MSTKKSTKKVAKTTEKTEEVKNQLGTQPDILPIEGNPMGDIEKDQGIEIGEPMDLRPKSLPLVVKVPEKASSAQKEYAKILNAYAYQNPKKWEKKKDSLIARLKMLKNEEVPEDPNHKLSIRGSIHSFEFIKMGKEEIYAGTENAASRVD